MSSGPRDSDRSSSPDVIDITPCHPSARSHPSLGPDNLKQPASSRRARRRQMARRKLAQGKAASSSAHQHRDGTKHHDPHALLDCPYGPVRPPNPSRGKSHGAHASDRLLRGPGQPLAALEEGEISVDRDQSTRTDLTKLFAAYRDPGSCSGAGAERWHDEHRDAHPGSARSSISLGSDEIEAQENSPIRRARDSASSTLAPASTKHLVVSKSSTNPVAPPPKTSPLRQSSAPVTHPHAPPPLHLPTVGSRSTLLPGIPPAFIKASAFVPSLQLKHLAPCDHDKISTHPLLPTWLDDPVAALKVTVWQKYGVVDEGERAGIQVKPVCKVDGKQFFVGALQLPSDPMTRVYASGVGEEGAVRAVAAKVIGMD